MSTARTTADGGANGTERDQLHELVNSLEAEDLPAARRVLQALVAVERMPAALVSAPWDDEPETEDERRAVEEARRDIAEGRLTSDEEFMKELDEAE